jgi:hypothetical protein
MLPFSQHEPQPEEVPVDPVAGGRVPCQRRVLVDGAAEERMARQKLWVLSIDRVLKHAVKE